jgi:hypothetical protein
MIVVMGTIFFLSHQSGDNLDLPSFFLADFPGADKLAHMIAYGGLALTVLWFFGEKGLENPGRTTFLTVLFCLLYGISDEYHQSFIDFRTVSIFDVLANTVGAFCCSLLWVMSPVLQQKMIACQINLMKCIQFK